MNLWASNLEPRDNGKETQLRVFLYIETLLEIAVVKCCISVLYFCFITC